MNYSRLLKRKEHKLEQETNHSEKVFRKHLKKRLLKRITIRTIGTILIILNSFGGMKTYADVPEVVGKFSRWKSEWIAKTKKEGRELTREVYMEYQEEAAKQLRKITKRISKDVNESIEDGDFSGALAGIQKLDSIAYQLGDNDLRRILKEEEQNIKRAEEEVKREAEKKKREKEAKEKEEQRKEENAKHNKIANEVLKQYKKHGTDQFRLGNRVVCLGIGKSTSMSLAKKKARSDASGKAKTRLGEKVSSENSERHKSEYNPRLHKEIYESYSESTNEEGDKIYTATVILAFDIEGVSQELLHNYLQSLPSL
jgi:hypothetical protein